MDEQQWKTYMTTELEEFLGEQSQPFVDACFQVIQTQAYQPGNNAGAATAPEAPAPMATELQVASSSRDTEMTDLSNGQPPQHQQQQRRPRCRDYHGALFQ